MRNLILTLGLVISLTSIKAQFSPWYDGSPCLYHQAEGNCAAFGSKLFVFHGFTNPQYDTACSRPKGQCISDTLAFFDPSTGPLDSQARQMGTWQQFQQMPIPVTHVDVARVDDEIWLVGGYRGDHGGMAMDTIQIYNPATDSWRFGPQLPVAHATGTTAQLGRRVYVTHGTADRGGVNDRHFVYHLDRPSLGWQELTPPPISLNHIGVAVMRGKIYTVGGQKCHDCFPTFHQSSLMVYDPETDAWTLLDSMPQSRSHIEPGVFAMDGELYVSGGNTNQGLSRDIISYNPDSALWKQSYFFNTPDLFKSYWAPAVKPIEDKLIFAHGGFTDYKIPRNETFILPITRNRRHELVFSKDTIAVHLERDSTTQMEALLWTYSGETPYQFVNSTPNWLVVRGRMQLRPSGDDIRIDLDAQGLMTGVYTHTLVVADGDRALPNYSSDSIVIVLTVGTSGSTPIDFQISDREKKNIYISKITRDDNFHFFTSTLTSSQVAWKVIGLQGREIFPLQKEILSKGKNRLQNSQALPQGIYLLWVRFDDEKVVLKKFLVF